MSGGEVRVIKGFCGETQEKKPLRRRRLKKENNMKMDL
jgi:hypothetical protein